MSTYYMKEYIRRNRNLGVCFGFGVVILIAIGITISCFAFNGEAETPLEKAEQLLSEALLFDGRNNLPTTLRDLVRNDLTKFNLSHNLSEIQPWASNKFGGQTDIPRLRAGKVKAQFWNANADCTSQYFDAVEIALEQIDLIKRLIANYSDDLELVTSSEELLSVVDRGKIASLIALGGGHSIQWSLAILRMYYELGVRSMTLTQGCSTPWADGSRVESEAAMRRQNQPINLGLTAFGEGVIREMNRIGMVIDLSESSTGTMKDVLIVSKAPVIFSHSASKAKCGDDNNVPDDILKLVRQKDALVMVGFHPYILKCADRENINTTIHDVVEHIEDLRNKTTVNNVGIGSDFDNLDRTTEGLEDVSKFPNLFAALIETGRWTDNDLEKLAGKNMLRVLQEVEKTRDSLSREEPNQSWLKRADLKKMGYNFSCTTAALDEPAQIPYGIPKYNGRQGY